MKLNKSIGQTFTILIPIAIIIAYYSNSINPFLSTLLIGFASSAIVIIIQSYGSYILEFRNYLTPILLKLDNSIFEIKFLLEHSIDYRYIDFEEVKLVINDFSIIVNDSKYALEELSFWGNRKIKKEINKFQKQLIEIDEQIELDIYYLNKEEIKSDEVYYILNIIKFLENFDVENLSEKCFNILYSVNPNTIKKNSKEEDRVRIIKKEKKEPKELHIGYIKKKNEILINYIHKNLFESEKRKSKN